jgi:hypothetical protein
VSADAAPTYTLDNGTPLAAQYDEANDSLSLWLDKPRPSRKHELAAGNLVHLDPHTREFLGLTITSFEGRWRGQAEIPLDAPVGKRLVVYSAIDNNKRVTNREGEHQSPA